MSNKITIIIVHGTLPPYLPPSQPAIVEYISPYISIYISITGNHVNTQEFRVPNPRRLAPEVTHPLSFSIDGRCCLSLAFEVGDAGDAILYVLHHLRKQEAEGAQAYLVREQDIVRKKCA